MPTVTVNGKKKVFPYNAVGKAQADFYARMHGGKKKNNPGPKMELTGNKEIDKQKINLQNQTDKFKKENKGLKNVVKRYRANRSNKKAQKALNKQAKQMSQ
ncbi:MAG: hypothetical protein GOVbin1629_71 [Prokaryotic dsDNA virus sp.]|nr:MAG: hypothetical protein GOVbin1629_71 [Prokaryotic dsDNA virus sp.]|tara:strand:- start:497 stop:799 length:303 start_codon:yes stop_codon:yes gene_type:complete